MHSALTCTGNFVVNNLYIELASSLTSGQFTAVNMSINGLSQPEYVNLSGNLSVLDSGNLQSGVYDITHTASGGFIQYLPNAVNSDKVTFNINAGSGQTYFPPGNYNLELNYTGESGNIASCLPTQEYSFGDTSFYGNNIIDLDINRPIHFGNLICNDTCYLSGQFAIFVSGDFSGSPNTSGSGHITFKDGIGDVYGLSTVTGAISVVDSSVTFHENLSTSVLTMRGGTGNFNGNNVSTTKDFKVYGTYLTGFEGTSWNVSGNLDMNGSANNLLNLAATGYDVNVRGNAIVNFGNISGLNASSGSTINTYSSNIN